MVIVLLSIISSLLLSLTNIIVSQMKVIWDIGDSVKAFYGANTGVERALYRIRKEGNFSNFSGEIEDISYNVRIALNGGITITSTGLYNNKSRAIQTEH